MARRYGRMSRQAPGLASMAVHAAILFQKMVKPIA
jgi:hypothetical protein